MDFDDDDAHLCGCDRACVCSDRFSWLAVPPTPVYCDGALPPILFDFTRFHRAATRRSKFPNLNSRSITQSQFSSDVTCESSAKLCLPGTNYVQARTHEASRSCPI